MSLKVTLRTGCSSAQEQLLNYADEIDIANQYYKTQLPPNIQAWNQQQEKLYLRTYPKSSFQHTRRSYSTIAKDYNSAFSNDSGKDETKQDLKFKLRHYQEQVLEPISNIHPQADLNLISDRDLFQKREYVTGFKIKGFERTIKLRNFSISRRKQIQVRSEKTEEIPQPKRITKQSSSKEKEVKQLRMTFYPLTAHFSSYEEEKKIVRKLKQYFKKGSRGTTL